MVQAPPSHVAILFADIAGYTRIEPRYYGEFAGIVLGGLASIVRVHHAILTNTWGDALVAVFSTTSEAALCGLDIRDLFVRGEWGSRVLPSDLAIRVALHAAEVYQGINPVTKRQDVWGRNVNLAARLEPMVTPNEVWATASFVLQAEQADTHSVAFDYVGERDILSGNRPLAISRVRRRNEAPSHIRGPVEQPRLIGQRGSDAVSETMARIARGAGSAEGFLCMSGVAIKDVFDRRGESELRSVLEGLLASGVDIRALLLSPNGVSAMTREAYEGRPDRVNVATRSAIQTSVGPARQLAKRFATFHLRAAAEMPTFLFFNQSEMVCHPYFSSCVGPDTDVLLARAGSSLYERARKHFEDWWGDRWLLLDLGNVLVGFEHRQASVGLSKALREVSPVESLEERIYEFLFAPAGQEYSRNDQLDLGRIDIAQLRQEFCKRFGDVSKHDFEESWNSIFLKDNSAAYALLSDLRQCGWKLALCSNTNQSHWRRLSQRFGKMLGSFDKTFLSFEVGHRKPEALFFEHVWSHTKAPPPHHVLVDDRDENVAGAQRAGMLGLRFRDFSTLRRDLTSLLWDSRRPADLHRSAR